jgi:stage IV sporulation protein FB
LYGAIALFLAEPAPTAWDLHFRLFGVPVRISPWFWVSNILLGWTFAQSVAQGSGGSVNVGMALAIWTVAVLVSIVIHEMGHSLMFRYFGTGSHIVLYQFGGIAVPDRALNSLEARRRNSPQENILISLAGPVTQILFAVALITIVSLAGYALPNPLPFIHALDFLRHGNPIRSIPLFALIYAFNYCSIWWALMNLLPVYPLDGGQISRETFLLSSSQDGIRQSLILSIITGAAVAVWALTQEKDTYLAIMFGMLAYSSFMTLQAYSGRGGGFGGNPW